ILVAWGLGGRERGKHTAGSGRVACRLRRHATGGRACGRKIERRATPPCAGNTQRLLARLAVAAPRAPGGAGRAERVWRTGCIRILHGIEGVATPARACGGCRGRTLGTDLRARPWCGLLLHAADLALELLVAKLQLLDCSGQLPDLGFEALKTQQEIGTRHLRHAIRSCGRRAAIAAQALASVEKAEQSKRTLALLGPSFAHERGYRDQRHQDERGGRRHTEREAGHGFCGVGALQTGYESLRPNCDCGQLTKSTIPARRGCPAKGVTPPACARVPGSCSLCAIARIAARLRRWRHEQHCQTSRCEHAGEYGDADRRARAGDGTARERYDAENEGE